MATEYLVYRVSTQPKHLMLSHVKSAMHIFFNFWYAGDWDRNSLLDIFGMHWSQSYHRQHQTEAYSGSPKYITKLPNQAGRPREKYYVIRNTPLIEMNYSTFIIIFERKTLHILIAQHVNISITIYKKLHPPSYIYMQTCISGAFIFCDNSSHQLAYCREDCSG